MRLAHAHVAHRLRTTAWFVAVLGIAGASCTLDMLSKDSCATNADCVQGFTCVNNRCLADGGQSGAAGAVPIGGHGGMAGGGQSGAAGAVPIGGHGGMAGGGQSGAAGAVPIGGHGGMAGGGQSGAAGAVPTGGQGGVGDGGQSGAAGAVPTGGQGGVGGGVSTGCTSDSSCLPGTFCDASGACSVGVVDQEALTWGANGPLGGSSAQEVAQIVTAGVTGRLVEVRLAVECITGGSITVQIQSLTPDGAPSGTVLSAVTAKPAPAQGSALPLWGIPLATPVAQTVGMQFAIVATGPALDFCALSFGPSNGVYPGGALFVDVLPNPPGWAPNPGYILFQTVVSP